ncbi:MAG: hypothetical protein CSA35_08015 [Dethiosulfovibrio peptidovorans]|nr:MAG: hypothetical protein CSA35_08015 [Dethiosulfovibrio peptidovorans]
MSDSVAQARKAIRRYNARFPDGFPSFPLMISSSPKEIIAIVEECLEKGKDVEELGYYTPPDIDDFD